MCPDVSGRLADVYTVLRAVAIVSEDTDVCVLRSALVVDADLDRNAGGKHRS